MTTPTTPPATPVPPVAPPWPAGAKFKLDQRVKTFTRSLGAVTKARAQGGTIVYEVKMDAGGSLLTWLESQLTAEVSRNGAASATTDGGKV